MTLIPKELKSAFADVDNAAINTWWSGLSENARQELAALCDERLDSCFFGVVNSNRDEIVPKVYGGRFIGHDDAWGFDEWGPSYFEHLVEHPELVIVWDDVVRKFYTGCTLHRDALNCWATGAVPSDFVCPFGKPACLMQPLMGKAIKRRILTR